MIKIQRKNCGRDSSRLPSSNKYIERIADLIRVCNSRSVIILLIDILKIIKWITMYYVKQ